MDCLTGNFTKYFKSINKFDLFLSFCRWKVLGISANLNFWCIFSCIKQQTSTKYHNKSGWHCHGSQEGKKKKTPCCSVQLVLPAGPPNWSVQLVCPAGPSSWSVQLVCPADPSSWSMYLIHLADLSCTCCKFPVLQIPCVANCTDYKFYMMQIACVANCTCRKIEGDANCTCYIARLQIKHVANCMY